MKRPKGFEGFYLTLPDGVGMSPREMLEWVMDNLGSFPDRGRHRWKIEFGQKADRLFREHFGFAIYQAGRHEWMRVGVEGNDNWEVRFRVGGPIGDARDMASDTPEIDRIMLSLDIDDIDALGYYDPYWRY